MGKLLRFFIPKDRFVSMKYDGANFSFSNIDRNILLIIVIGFSLLAYPMCAIVTLLDINPLDPLYYEEKYSSTYAYTIDDEDEIVTLFFSEPINSTLSKAIFSIDNINYTTLVSSDGYWINTSQSSTPTNFSILFWFFLGNPITNRIKGDVNAYGPNESWIIDPWGLIGKVNETYRIKYVKSYIETFEKFSTQTSNLYDVCTFETNISIGQALYDITTGVLWWIDVYNREIDNGVYVELSDTDFLISRNRFTTMFSMIALFIFAYSVIYLLMKKKKYSKPRIRDINNFVVLGFFAFFIDGILDIWFTSYYLILVLIHLMYMILAGMLTYKRDNWRVIFIPPLELLMCMVMFFFKGDICLVLTYTPGLIATWAALAASIRGKMDKEKILQFRWNWIKIPESEEIPKKGIGINGINGNI